MTEETLMAAYCEGDRKAFEQLFARLGLETAWVLHAFVQQLFDGR